MKKTRIIAPIIVVCLVAIAWVCFLSLRVRRNRDRDAQAVATSWEIGRELVATTNSTRLIEIQRGVQKRLGEFLTCPARVEAVRMGDEVRPADTLKATSRVYLVNDKSERLALRLEQDSDPGKFRVLGFWVPTSAPEQEGR
jgi:hypothetical protein